MKLLLLLAVIVVLAVSGCTAATAPSPEPTPPVAQPPAPSAEPPATPLASPPEPPATPPPAPPAPEPTVREFSVTAKQFEFAPSTFTVNQGDTVRFRVTSVDVTHGFFVSGYGESAQLAPGQEAVLEFVADQKGTFTISCSVFCGSGHGGMRAELIVQ